MATFTASQNQSEVRAIHTGVNVVRARADIATRGTASSVVLLVKVPNKAVIVDYMWYVDDGGAQHLGPGLRQSRGRQHVDPELAAQRAVVDGRYPRQRIEPDAAVSHLALGRCGAAVDLGCGHLCVAISASAHYKFTLFYTMGETA